MLNIIEIKDFNAQELDVYARLTEAQLLNKDHLEDGMHADGTWLYYGKPDEGFFFLLWFEDEGEAMTKQAQLSADPAVCCWLVDLEKDITTVE